jgi:hypothetical protein
VLWVTGDPVMEGQQSLNDPEDRDYSLRE